LRVYQFRHRRVGGQYSPERGPEQLGEAAGSAREEGPKSSRRAPFIESVLGQRYISEHMFDRWAQPRYTEQGVDGWI
jgi:hypothetical protein